jgi:hypothetical protein
MRLIKFSSHKFILLLILAFLLPACSTNSKSRNDDPWPLPRGGDESTDERRRLNP